MRLQGKALRINIYIGESDHYQGRALFMALLELLKREGASGATVVRGLSGFGARSRIHTATILTLSEDLPLRLEWVDKPEVVERLLPQVREMVDDGLITVEEVNVVQYAPGRKPDPLAQPIQDVMRKEVFSVSPETPVADIVTMLVQRGYRSLPVVDKDDHPAGIITDGDLLQRARLYARLDLQAELSTEDWRQQLAELRQRSETAADLMTQPVVTVNQTDSLRQAVIKMVEGDLKRLPVTDTDGRLVGWISRVDVLHTLEYHRPRSGKGTDEALPSGTTIATLMYHDVPTVSPQTGLEGVMQALEQNRRRRAVVVDDHNHVQGIITDGDLLRRSQPQIRSNLLSRLRALVSGHRTTSVALPEATKGAANLMTSPAITVTTATPLADALRLMLKHRIKRLPVVDESGRLVGLLGRASLLRGLLALSEPPGEP
jgi:CBS domain-containing protein